MKVQFHQGHALDVLALDPGNTGHVQEVELVIVGQQPLDLIGIEAAVGLANVNDRLVEGRKNIDLGAI